MLWDIIRDFIVQYLTGGHTSSEEEYFTFVGKGFFFGESGYDDSFMLDSSTYVCKIGESQYNEQLFSTYISFGDWLATTLTIIFICVIAYFGYWLIRWIFKVVSSAFLLK